MIRHATTDDAEDINRIANWYILNTAINFDTQTWDIEKRCRWIDEFNQPDLPYQLLVLEQSKRVVGFANNTQFRPKPAYNRATETSIYLDHAAALNGYGTILYQALLERIAEFAFHRAYAVITLPNRASVRLHEKFDFKLAGTLNQIGFKFDQYHDVAMYEKSLSDIIAAPEQDKDTDEQNR